MSAMQCHRCGKLLLDGSLKYQVDMRVQSFFDGVIPEEDQGCGAERLDCLLDEISACTEEELLRQVYEHDVFIMCPECKEAFMNDLYSRLHPAAVPEAGREHLIN